MLQARKKYYRLYRGWFCRDKEPHSEWELQGVYLTIEKVWAGLFAAQAEWQKWRKNGPPVPLRIVEVIDPDNSPEFDPWEDDGDETFIDEKGCSLDEWTRLNLAGEVE